MIKGTLTASAVFLAFQIHAQTVLNIGEGETYTVTKDMQVMVLDELSLGKNAAIEFSEDVSEWQLTAKKANFAEGAFIDGRGNPGVDNAGKITNASESSPCQNGDNGKAGLPGGSGRKGVDINMKFGISQFSSLRIDTSGGQGGSGGDGGKGGQGGLADDCHGGDGGNGGIGGDGGYGGNGGNVSITYWTLGASEYIPTSNYGPGIQIVTLPGLAGLGGEGGLPGEGGRGTFEKRASGKKIYRNEGEPGTLGSRGKPGEAGKPGKFLIQPVLKPQLDAQR